ncbi:MAG: thioredoxin [Endomicrobia bacterium]|nr:thioredoxin [Endomicrobiia bacterium]MDW8055364.1 thioredoxin [Elusimicrobiota bacterium]
MRNQFKEVTKMAKEINEANFEQEVIKSTVPVLVDFWAEWCGPCRMLSPIIEELSKAYSEQQIKICKVNVDENPRLASRYSIMAIPTVIIFKNGKPYEQVTGVRSKKEFEEMIKRALI